MEVTAAAHGRWHGARVIVGAQERMAVRVATRLRRRPWLWRR